MRVLFQSQEEPLTGMEKLQNIQHSQSNQDYKQSSCLHGFNVIQCHAIEFCSINLQIAPGQLVAVVGQVGAGKSSLIQAMLGEMKKREGSVTLQVNNAQVLSIARLLE